MMTTIAVDHSVRCGNTRVHGAGVHHHETVAQVRLCHFRGEGLASLEEAAVAGLPADTDYEFDPDAAYERSLERDPVYAFESEMDEIRASYGLPGAGAW